MVPTMRKALISKVFGLNRNEARSAAPITDISDMSANTEERKENKYKDAIAEIIIPSNVNSLVDLMTDSSAVFFILATRTPKAKALESIVPINAAIRETMRSDPSHPGKAPRTPSVNKLDGSAVIPANLKLIPR